TLWALILPVTVNAFNFVIMRNFFQGIPESLEEAARIDGCSEVGVFVRVVLPLSLASIATIGLFYAVTYCNTYMHAILYINDSTKWPIQILLRQIVIVSSGMNADAAAVEVVPPAQSVKMAVITVVTLPMLAVYPFVQRYFVKGALIDSVKGCITHFPPLQESEEKNASCYSSSIQCLGCRLGDGVHCLRRQRRLRSGIGGWCRHEQGRHRSAGADAGLVRQKYGRWPG